MFAQLRNWRKWLRSTRWREVALRYALRLALSFVIHQILPSWVASAI